MFKENLKNKKYFENENKVKFNIIFPIALVIFISLAFLVMMLAYKSSFGIAFMIMAFSMAPQVLLYSFPANIVFFSILAISILLAYKIIKSKFYQNDKIKMEKIIHYLNLIFIIIIFIYIIGFVFVKLF